MKIKSLGRKVGWTILFCAISTLLHAEVIQIADLGLEGAIRQALNKPTGAITRADMETLQVLDASRMTRGPAAPAIQSFSGLEAAINLTALDCSGIFLFIQLGPPYEWPETRGVLTSDFSPLAGLPNLRSLALRQNRFTNITFSSGFERLETLNLGQNSQLTGLSLPKSMSNLKTLLLDSDSLHNPIFLAGLTSLKHLDLWNNRLTNSLFLNDLFGLRSLNLTGNQLAGFAFLSRMNELEDLRLDYIGNSIVLPPGMTNLVTLSLAGNWLTNLDFLASLTKLRVLDVSGNWLTNLDFLVSLTKLRVLDVSGNWITNFPDGLRDLTELKLSLTRIRDLNFLRDMWRLEKLVVNSSGLESGPADLHFLETFSGLRELTLSGQAWGNFVLPVNLASLELLSVQAASLTNIDLPTSMPRLHSLDLSDNQLTSIALPEAPELRELIVGRNQLKRLVLPARVSNLINIDVSDNLLAAFALPQAAGAVQDPNVADNVVGTSDFAPARESLITLTLGDNPIQNLEFLANFKSLEALSVNGTGLDRITLPEGLTSLKQLTVAFSPGWPFGDVPPDFLGIPASIHLDSLRILGFSKEKVTVLGFWIDELIHQTPETVSLNFRGAPNKGVHVQRTSDLVQWETVSTMATGPAGHASYSSEVGGSGQKEFFRVIPGE